ncbi:MAG: histidinol dehydrogenase [Treponema sp.]|nr:histidinol dehydrogenase [Treponema sp.]
MIRIQKADEIGESFFEGRDFGDSLEAVKDVLRDVKSNGDEALHRYTAKFDLSNPAAFEIPMSVLKDAADKMKKDNPDLYKSISYSHELALRFAQKQKESFGDFETELEPGVFTGQNNIAVDKAGVYVPAGRFPLVSSVIMTVTPAVAAGVKEIILCTPPRVHPADRDDAQKKGLGIPGKPYTGGRAYADDNIMAAAYICGVTKAFALGGSQAIAALAFGTQSVPKVDVVVGPGNKFVAEAKKLVYGTVGIDMLAGPTEVFIIADSSANPEWVAADLLAQAEHDIVAQPILATPDENLARKVADEIEKQLLELPTQQTARTSVQDFGRIIITKDLDEAAMIANRKAPEHLELAMSEGTERDRIASTVHNYGSLFIGHSAAEVFGDYAAGLNHTLPTSGSARFTGGLSVRMFLKTVTTLRVDSGGSGAAQSARAAKCLGEAEGLAAHAQSANLRLKAFTNSK